MGMLSFREKHIDIDSDLLKIHCKNIPYSLENNQITIDDETSEDAQG